MGIQHSKVLLRLHILSGSFVDAGGGGGGGGCPMDASVWSRLPYKLLWRVLGFVPAAKLYQWHTVSRKWRRVLISGRFHRTSAAAAAAAEDPERQRRRRGGVVACVSAGNAVNNAVTRVVDMDLTMFVPSCFWTRHQDDCRFANAPATTSLSVVAAGNGLVCICDHLRCRCPAVTGAGDILYCVLNPLTRTCVVLPLAPFPPPPVCAGRPLGCHLLSEEAAAAPALTASKWDDDEGYMVAATCDLQQAADADGGADDDDDDNDGLGPRSAWITLHKSGVATVVPPAHEHRCRPALVQCEGQFFFYHAGRVQVLAAAPTGTAPMSEEEARGTNRRRLDEAGGAASTAAATTSVDALDGPLVASLGLDVLGFNHHDACGWKVVVDDGALVVRADDSAGRCRHGPVPVLHLRPDLFLA